MRSSTFGTAARAFLFVMVLGAAAIWLRGFRVVPVRGPQTVDELLARMTLEEKVGQMLMFGLPGKEVSTEARRAIEARRVGGIILFSRNVTDAGQVAGLNGELQSLAAGRGKSQVGRGEPTAVGRGIGLFISVDQEGGPIARLRQGFTVFPAGMALGAAGSEDLAYQSARAVAAELRAVGVNMNLAPDVDVNNNPANPVIGVRSYGEDPDLVGRLGVVAIRGYRDGGVIATAKHFPGHGDTSVDSHLALPEIKYDRKRLDQVELAPFRAAIGAGAEVIMPAHIIFPAVDPTPGLPATLSEKALTGLLRRELGFEGLIITDAMDVMKAITDNFGKDKALVMAVKAGADVVLFAESFGEQEALYNILLDAVKRGEIPQERVDASVRRILSLKAKYGLIPEVSSGAPPGLTKPSGAAPESASGLPDPASGSVSTPEARRLAETVAAQSITLVRDDAKTLPLRASDGKRILVVTPAVAGADYSRPATSLRSWVGDALARRHPGVWELQVDRRPTSEQVSKALEMAAVSDYIILGSYNLNLEPQAAQIAGKLAAMGKPLILVALGNPYDLIALPSARTYLAAYGYSRESAEGLAAVIFGEIQPAGRLPVSLPGLYPRGSAPTDAAGGSAAP